MYEISTTDEAFHLSRQPWDEEFLCLVDTINLDNKLKLKTKIKEQLLDVNVNATVGEGS